MPIPSYLAVLIETGSFTGDGRASDSKLIRYITSIYPQDAGVEMVVTDLEDFRSMSKLQEPRLAVLLEGLAFSVDCGLATKCSENGKMIGRLQMEQQATVPKSSKNKDDQTLDEMNYTESKADIGNRKYQ